MRAFQDKMHFCLIMHVGNVGRNIDTFMIRYRHVLILLLIIFIY